VQTVELLLSGIYASDKWLPNVGVACDGDLKRYKNAIKFKGLKYFKNDISLSPF
jgi:hypothetical protein